MSRLTGPGTIFFKLLELTRLTLLELSNYHPAAVSNEKSARPSLMKLLPALKPVVLRISVAPAVD